MTRRTASLRERMVTAVTAVLAVAVLVPAVAWVSITAPAAWGSWWFSIGFASASLGVIAASAIVAARLARSLIEPIEAATRRIEYLAESGNDLPAPSPASTVEIERLMKSIGHLVQTSKAREERLGTAVGALAHDVRIGLRSVATALSQARDTETGVVHLSMDAASLVEAEISRARAMTSDLVVLMRSPVARVAGAPALIELAALCRQVVESVATASRVPISIEVQKPFSRSVPSGLVERILRNLLDNAVRFARSGVVVRVFDGLIAIVDDGPGFESDASSGVPSGLHGYGFQIASRLAELAGGRVAIERSGANGTVVLVYL